MIRSHDGCGYQLTMLQLLEEYNIISAIIFVSIGVAMCFGGYKLYKDMLTVFAVLISIVLGFYLYMAYVEKSSLHNGKIWLVLLLLVGIMGVFAAVIFLQDVVYFLCAALISYKLGLLFHTMLEKKFEFF